MTTLAHAPLTPVRPETAPDRGLVRPAPNDRPAHVSEARDRTGLLRRLARVLQLWRRRAQESQELLSMSDLALRDIGISRREAWRQASKPFWRA